MQTLLTLPVRLFAIVLVAWAAWTMVSPTARKVELALVNIKTIDAQQSSSVEPLIMSKASSSIDWRGKPLFAILFCVAVPLTFYVAFEVIRFQRFCKSCDAIKRLGGRIAASPNCENSILGYVFSTFTVDLSGTEVSDANCPSFRAIPFLTKVRLGDTRIGRQTINELSWCRHLASLDLSGTSIQRRETAALLKLKKLENLLID